MELDFETLNSLLEQTKPIKVFPFIIRNGYQNVSERGFESKGTSSYFFSFFQKVFTGSETITATWEDSTQLNVRDASLGTYNYDFQVGKYFEGIVVPSSEMHNIEITNVNGNDSFLAMQNNGDINVLFFYNSEVESEHNFEFEEEYLYKLYIMPETNFGNKWLFISNISKHQSPANPNLIIYTVTFSSLKDKLEQSGRALEQYVQYAAPGEPYAFPYITSDDEVIVSPLRYSEYINSPVKYLQVELQGANAFGSITVLGRRLYWDEENEKWYTSPSKFLVPYKFVVPQANPLAKTSSPTKNFYVFPDETIETRSNAEWLTAIKNQDSALAPMQNIGAFTMSGTWTDTIHCSNTLNDGHHYDYNDTSWKPLKSFESLPTVTSNGNMYCSDSIVYNSNDSLIQILIKNSMANLLQLELPLDMKQTRPYRWSNIPVIGFWTRWFGDRAINQNSTNVKTNHLCYLIDTNLATMQYNAFTQSSTPYGNLQMFSGENAPAGLNPQSANTTLCFRLTDKVTFTDTLYNDNTEHSRPLADGVDTVYWSQKTDEYGVNLHTDGTAFLLNTSDNSIEPKYVDYGFVIDNVIVQGLHIGKVKISCYSDNSGSAYGACDRPIFTQTVLSNSMFEQNNIRNWTTNLTLGTWDSNWSSGDITWPLSPQKEIMPYLSIEANGRKFVHPNGEYRLNNEHGLPSTKDNNKTCYYENTIYENTINYSELPGSYEDRTDFLSKVGNIYLSVGNSTFELTGIGKCNLQDKYIHLDLNDLSEYKLTKTQALGAFNDQSYNPLSLVENQNLYTIINLNVYSKAKANQVVKVELQLYENSIYLKMTETISISGYEWSGGTLNSMYLVNGRSSTELTQSAQVKVNKILFVEK